MAVIQNIKNKLGTIVYPKTLTKAVYEEDGTRLDNEISAITSDISSLNDTFATVTGNAPTINSYNTFSYPTGFNKDNSMVVSAQYKNTGNGMWCDIGSVVTVAQDINGGIGIYPTVSYACGEYRLTLRKI